MNCLVPRTAFRACASPGDQPHPHQPRRTAGVAARFQLVAADVIAQLRPPRQPAQSLPLHADQVSRYQGKLSGPLLDRL